MAERSASRDLVPSSRTWLTTRIEYGDVMCNNPGWLNLTTRQFGHILEGVEPTGGEPRPGTPGILVTPASTGFVAQPAGWGPDGPLPDGWFWCCPKDALEPCYKKETPDTGEEDGETEYGSLPIQACKIVFIDSQSGLPRLHCRNIQCSGKCRLRGYARPLRVEIPVAKKSRKKFEAEQLDSFLEFEAPLFFFTCTCEG